MTSTPSPSTSAEPPAEALAGRLADFLRRHRRVAVLTGAGVSTASGIPDYRDADGEWKHARPVMFDEFRRDPAVRRRYWARSLVGWESFRRARPNAAHAALARIEEVGRVSGLVTQNVDRLHQQAGHRRVLDLHGRLDEVTCLDCSQVIEREALQRRLQTLNPDFVPGPAAARPDGDAEVSAAALETFRVPDCPACDGVLKPAVVFFGENVPRVWVQAAARTVTDADALLVVGSSLMVFSGYRFARQAAREGKEIAIVGLGRTRADELASLRLRADCGALLTETWRQLAG
jgi:NAD-dependent SIR2 family protein deacetylase